MAAPLISGRSAGHLQLKIRSSRGGEQRNAEGPFNKVSCRPTERVFASSEFEHRLSNLRGYVAAPALGNIDSNYFHGIRILTFRDITYDGPFVGLRFVSLDVGAAKSAKIV